MGLYCFVWRVGVSAGYEWPQNYNATFATGTTSDGIAYGTGTTYFGNSGDLSLVRQYPVVLTNSGKVVYSVHEYPPETSGNANDAASALKIANMTAIWGYLVKENIAPVWIGEMGSYFNGTAAQIAESTAWMNMMISYMNGTTTGGLQGTLLELICTTSTLWHISGIVIASGTIATPFATS